MKEYFVTNNEIVKVHLENVLFLKAPKRHVRQTKCFASSAGRRKIDQIGSAWKLLKSIGNMFISWSAG